MPDCLCADALMTHVRALAQGIGPRPPGHPADAQARGYVRRVLADAGLQDVHELPFWAWNTWGYSLGAPVALSLLGNVIGMLGRPGKLVGGTASLASAYQLFRVVGAHRQPFAFVFPKRQTANVVARIPPSGERWRRVVLVGHVDTNKHRPTFGPTLKHLLLAAVTGGIGLAAVNGLAQLGQAAGAGRGARRAQQWSLLSLASVLALLLYDERGGYVDGANDNASAVACLLGLGIHFGQQPLQHTEVWLAFTGAEEVGCVGMHKLLDVYGDELTDAWFIDFEMVGTDEVAYVTRHSSASYLTGYAPDDESLALARETQRRYPELGVGARDMVIVEEIGTLRGRGYRGICLVGVGKDGWLENWHRYADCVDNVRPAGLERAARFALAMMEALDAGPASDARWADG
jgi:hypothetical protein